MYHVPTWKFYVIHLLYNLCFRFFEIFFTENKILRFFSPENKTGENLNKYPLLSSVKK